jgi:hypothetical protein
VEGKVKSLQWVNDSGEQDSNGKRFLLSLRVAKLLKKAKGKNPTAKETIRLGGWRKGRRRQEWIPEVGENVSAHLLSQRDGIYEVLAPRGLERKERVTDDGGRGDDREGDKEEDQ